MQVILLIITVIGAILGFIGVLTCSVGVGGIGALVGIKGVVFQYFIGKPFIKDFTEDDWIKSNDEYLLSVPARRHRRGRGIAAKVYQSSDGSYEAFYCGEEEAKDGSFSISVVKPFRGRLVPK
jgi:hypothetical protein